LTAPTAAAKSDKQMQKTIRPSAANMRSPDGQLANCNWVSTHMAGKSGLYNGAPTGVAVSRPPPVTRGVNSDGEPNGTPVRSSLAWLVPPPIALRFRKASQSQETRQLALSQCEICTTATGVCTTIPANCVGTRIFH
jgi:hypothetical protein